MGGWGSANARDCDRCCSLAMHRSGVDGSIRCFDMNDLGP